MEKPKRTPNINNHREHGNDRYWIFGILRNRTFIICILLFIFSFLIRLYNIEDYTEFLGDQGSAGVVIMEHWVNRTIPLVGPMVSTGQRPGPAYYYLVMPWWILSKFNPVAPAIGMALYSALTVVFIYLLLEKVSNSRISALLALLFTISPLLFDRSRNAWNPTSIPMFVTLALYILIKIREKRDIFNKRALFAVGFVNGVIIQLHYGSGMFLLFSLGVICGFAYKYQERKFKSIFLIIVYFGFGIILTLVPFLWYQIIHRFEDFRSLLLLFLSPQYIKDITRLPINRPSFLDLSSRLFFHAIYMPEYIQRVIAQFGIIGITLFLGVVFEKIIVVFYIFALLLLHFYNGPVPDHYLNFLVPFPFLLIAILLRKIHEKNRFLAYTIPIFLICLQLFRYTLTPPLVEKRMDIPRTQWFVEQMKQQSGGKPFSFTPVRSRSFSDYHYRFFFEKNLIYPEHIEKGIYDKMFLTCETDNCPAWDEIKNRQFIEVLCFDHVCGSNYPKIDISKWKLTGLEENPYIGKLYILGKL